MALTPADVHNVAFSKPRIGKRGYDELEVDLFVDLVEQELLRHIAEDSQLRKLNAQLRDRDGGLQKREAELEEREASVAEREAVLRRQVRKHESLLSEQKAELAKREAKLARQPTPLPQQVAQLRHREAQVAQREAQLVLLQAQLDQRQAALSRQEAELGEWQTELRLQEADLCQRLDQQRALPQQLSDALTRSAPVSGTSRTRAVASAHGRHDMERMAIRAVTDTLGNTVTETVHERTRRSGIDDGGRERGAEQSTELDRLREENAALARSLRGLKAAAALLASALNGP